MDYDYELYCEILQVFMEDARIDRDELVRGEDISDIPEVKIIFDGYGDLEDEDENGEYRYTEGGNTKMESYAIFIHKDALQKEFMFPEHDTAWNMIIHRPKEEVCIYAWYDVEAEEWEFLQLEDRIDSDHTMNEEDVMKILHELWQRYFMQNFDLGV
jgi:hypothetical protein